jgi:hypothetical protein
VKEYLIGISGKVGAGKTSVAEHLREHFGIVTHLEISDYVVVEMNEELKKKGLPIYHPGISNKEIYRPHMQRLGIERRQQDPDYWIKLVSPHIKGPTTISGIRYVNEIDYIKDHKGEVWRIRRPEVDDDPTNKANLAETEQQLDKYKYFDAIIMNCWGIYELKAMVSNLMKYRQFTAFIP